ncbi:MAG: YadA-like family protein, partial [Luteimonas sp.]
AGEEGTLLTNLAQGEVSAESTDAVTGSQLFETNERVEDLDGRIGNVEGVAANAIAYDDDSRAVATLDGADGTLVTNLAAGRIGSGSTDAVTGGQVFGSMESVATALGGRTVVDAGGRLIGTVYSVQGSYYGNVGDALGALDGQIGLLGRRIADVETRVPTETVGGGNDRVAVGGTGSATIGDQTNAIAAGDGAYAHGPNDIAIGSNAYVGADGSTAVGSNSTITADATNAVAVGEGSSVSAASGTAIGQGASVTAEGAVALGQGSVADRANTVSVGSAGNERQVTNVAAGTADTDAANVAQVNAAAAESRTYTDNVATQTLSSANAYTDQQFAAWNDNFEAFRGDVERRFHDVDRRLDRQGAMGAAMLNMATSAAGIRTQNRVGVGVGFQGGESALSVGYQRAISERATVTFGGAFSGDQKSVGVGAGFGW